MAGRGMEVRSMAKELSSIGSGEDPRLFKPLRTELAKELRRRD